MGVSIYFILLSRHHFLVMYFNCPLEKRKKRRYFSSYISEPYTSFQKLSFASYFAFHFHENAKFGILFLKGSGKRLPRCITASAFSKQEFPVWNIQNTRFHLSFSGLLFVRKIEWGRRTYFILGSEFLETYDSVPFGEPWKFPFL